LSKAREMRNSFSSSCSQVILVHLHPFRPTSLEVCTATENHKRSIKALYLGIQCHSSAYLCIGGRDGRMSAPFGFATELMNKRRTGIAE